MLAGVGARHHDVRPAGRELRQGLRDHAQQCRLRQQYPRAGIFQTDSAYRDLDNTYDPGGRLGQIALRFNW